MRKFLILLSKIARFFLLFEKSINNGHQEEVVLELKKNREEISKLRTECLSKIEGTNQCQN